MLSVERLHHLSLALILVNHLPNEAQTSQPGAVGTVIPFLIPQTSESGEKGRKTTQKQRPKKPHNPFTINTLQHLANLDPPNLNHACLPIPPRARQTFEGVSADLIPDCAPLCRTSKQNNLWRDGKERPGNPGEGTHEPLSGCTRPRAGFTHG